jgi:YhcH/YjgK/YiaL family protein
MAIFGSVSSVRDRSPRSSAFDRAFAYLDELLASGSGPHRRLLALASGQSARLELGDGVHAIEQAYLTRTRAEGRWESHLGHLDLQVVVSGEEIIEVAEVSRLTRTEDLTPAKDVVFYAPPAAVTSLRLRAGDAAVLFPPDGHLTGLQVAGPTLVHKTVVKVPVR